MRLHLVQAGRTYLRWGALFTGAAALLHLAIIAGGPAWYRFFGAGEQMARLAAWGSAYPAVLTAAIAAILGIWALYGLSGAGVIRRLPLLRPVLILIAGAFVARGLLGVPVVMLAGGAYAAELQGRMGFMVASSLVCLVLGACYAIGAAAVPRIATPPASEGLVAAAAGLGAGAILGASAAAGLLFVLGGTARVAGGRGLVLVCAAYGAMLGLVLAPLTRVLLLRDVPLRRAAMTTFAGALVGIVAGCVIGPRMGYALAWPAALGLMGFGLSALIVRRVAATGADA